MADEHNTPESDGQASNPAENKGPQFAIERLYMKDISLETPLGFEAFKKQNKSRIDLDINTSQISVGENHYEVTLRLTVTMKDQETDEVYYLIEINQAGVFLASGFSDDDRRKVLATAAPTTLFPYARESIDSLVVKAGFSPLRLAPINFEALLQAAVAQQQQQETAPTGTVQ